MKGFDSLKQVLPVSCLLEPFCANIEPDNSILIFGILDTFGRAQQLGAQDLARVRYRTRPATLGLRVVKSDCQENEIYEGDERPSKSFTM